MIESQRGTRTCNGGNRWDTRTDNRGNRKDRRTDNREIEETAEQREGRVRGCRVLNLSCRR